MSCETESEQGWQNFVTWVNNILDIFAFTWSQVITSWVLMLGCAIVCLFVCFSFSDETSYSPVSLHFVTLVLFHWYRWLKEKLETEIENSGWVIAVGSNMVSYILSPTIFTLFSSSSSSCVVPYSCSQMWFECLA